jgi:hypothetical protein
MPSAAAVPPSVTVPGGSAVSPPFTITTNLVGAPTQVTISASDGTNTPRSKLLTLRAILPAAVKLSPKSVLGGNSTTDNTVTLNNPARASGATGSVANRSGRIC